MAELNFDFEGCSYKLQEDVEDMVELVPDFERCDNCSRIKTKGYLCPHCNHDNSTEGGEDD